MITDKKYIKIDINKLEEFPDNPRIHDDQDINQLASYIKKAGYIDPVIIDEHNMILAGHRRVLALHELEYEEIDVVQVFGLTDAEKIAYVIADNKLNESTLSGIIDSLLENNRKIYRGLKDSELKVQGMDGAKIISEKLLEERIV